MASYKPTPRAFHNSGLVDGKVVVCSGETQGDSVQSKNVASTVEVFYPYSEQWTAKQCAGELPALGLRRAASAVVNDHLYSYGGKDGEGKFVDFLYQLNVKTYKWTRLPAKGESPMPKASAEMVACGNDLAVFGGHGIPHGPAQRGSSFIKSPFRNDGAGWTNEFHIYHLNRGMYTCTRICNMSLVVGWLGTCTHMHTVLH